MRNLLRSGKNDFPKLALAVTILTLALISASSFATSYGPFLPPHHYPTDRSLHLGYNFSILRTSKDFIGGRNTQYNNSNTTYRLIRHEFTPEYQANRKLSFGAKLSLDSGKIYNPIGLDKSKSSLGDQFMFMEFRAYDTVGSSLGFGTVIKFPGYSNATVAELAASDDPNNTVLIGDGQIDITALVTSENWLNKHWRLQADLGYTYRADGFAPQMPYMVSIGFVTPKMDFSFRGRGAMSLGSGSANTSETENIRDAFAQSDWALSPSPSIFILEPVVELWITGKWAVNIQYSTALFGSNAPSFSRFATGLIYRWSETSNKPVQKFKEVPIWQDQDAGKFEGEGSTDDAGSLLMEQDPVFEDND